MMKKLRRFLIIVIIIVSVLGFFFPYPQPHFWWQKIPIFDSIFGFIGCIVIILASKWIGHTWLMKQEDFYDQ